MRARDRRARAALSISLAALVAAAGAATPARADDAALLEKVERLEARVRELEAERSATRDGARVNEDLEARVRELETSRTASAAPTAADWTRRLNLSGSFNGGYYDGGPGTSAPQGGFRVWDSRFFLDADLARDVDAGAFTLARDVGFSFEWNLVRLGDLENDVGEAYVDFQGLGGVPWMNVQAGRFQLPVGENYLRFSRGYHTNPFISNTVGGAWWWDEGIRAYGSVAEGRFGWVASVSDGETPFNQDPSSAKQMTLKLMTDPTPWLHLSVSGLRSGRVGSSSEPASGSLWLGETWATPVGHFSPLPTFDHGLPVPDGPNEMRDTWYLGADAIVRVEGAFRLWLSYGRMALEAQGDSAYDRTLHSWIAELILEGRLAAPGLAPLYLGLRANGLGTYDSNRGYLLDVYQSGLLGYNASALDVYSLVAGWRLNDRVTLRAEYSLRDAQLVHGVTPAIRRAAGSENVFGFEVGAFF